MSNLFSDQQSGLPGFEHKDGTWVTLAYISGLFGVTERAVQLWAKDGIIPESDKGMYLMEACVKGVYLHQRNLIAGASSSQLTDERAKREAIRRERDQILLDEMKGTLINIDDVITDVGNLLMVLRTKGLYLPRLVAQAIPDQSTAVKREEITKKIVFDNILAEMEQYDPGKFRRNEGVEEPTFGSAEVEEAAESVEVQEGFRASRNDEDNQDAEVAE